MRKQFRPEIIRIFGIPVMFKPSGFMARKKLPQYFFYLRYYG